MPKDNNRKPAHGGGPKTEQGKARSSMNSLRHGLTGKTVLLPTEDPGQFQELLDDYIREFKPGSSIETDLIHELVVCRWRLQRMWNIETLAFEITIARKKDAVENEFVNPTNSMRTALAFMAMAEEGKAISLMIRYETRMTRRYDQILKELKALQDQRKKSEQPAPTEPGETNCPKPLLVPKPQPKTPATPPDKLEPDLRPAS